LKVTKLDSFESEADINQTLMVLS